MKRDDQEIAVNNQKEETERLRTDNKEKIIHRAKYEKQGKSESKLLDGFDQMNGRTSAMKGGCKEASIRREEVVKSHKDPKGYSAD